MTRSIMRGLVLALVCAMTSGTAVAQRAVDDVLTRLGGPDARALLLFFVASDCPISHRYFPEMERLRQEFATEHVAVRYVYPNPEETAANVAHHQVEFHAPTALAHLDPKGVLVQTAGVSTTPEAALFVRKGNGWTEIFHGRIDDRYVRFGVERPRPEHHDAEDAVRALLAHRAIPHPDGPPVGCAIVRASVIHGAAGE